jgi:predicted Zn-dependent peptidase
MKQIVTLFLMLCPLLMQAKDGYKLDITEFNLENGLHVILHKNNSAPNVVIGVKYHVGSKNEDPELTGFAHFFEHLLFHGSKNIPQGEFDRYILAAGGYDNAYTNYDVTYYYEFLPSHEYKLGLWLESERMLHPIITQEGIDTEREVVKEEKRLRYDKTPLGNVYNDLFCSSFKTHPYSHPIIGSMEHLDAANTKDFEEFFATYYVPNNACLVIAGDIDMEATKEWVNKYFAGIPRGKEIKRPVYDEERPGKEVIIEKSIKGIKSTHIAMSYFAAPENTQDANVITMISVLLSRNGESSILEKNITQRENSVSKKMTSSDELYEQAGMLWIKGNVAKDKTNKEYIAAVDSEIEKLRDKLVSKTDLQKAKNSLKSGYMDMYYDMESVADMLTSSYHIWGDASKFNSKIDDFMKITPKDIQRVAKKYLYPENRTMIIYSPEKN